jgi:hypothetical protein
MVLGMLDKACFDGVFAGISLLRLVFMQIIRVRGGSMKLRLYKQVRCDYSAVVGGISFRVVC